MATGHTTTQAIPIPRPMRYHAYLPPTTLQPPGSFTSFPDVQLHEVPLEEKATRSTNVRAEAETALLPNPSPDAFHPSSAPGASAVDNTRRRSKRLRTSHADTTGTQPLEVSETPSHLSSLNTTASQSGHSLPSGSLCSLPKWTIPLSKLVTLSSLLSSTPRRTRSSLDNADRKRVSVLCCIMTVDSPVQRARRRPGARGRPTDLWVATWRVSAPGAQSKADPVSCDVKLWDECARDWGGRVRKGDVVLLEDTSFQPASSATDNRAQLVLSPSNGFMPPEPIILYRTLPRYNAVRDDYVYRAGARGAVEQGRRGDMNREDAALRPDLRLARSDPGLRRVAELAQWCAEWCEVFYATAGNFVNNPASVAAVKDVVEHVLGYTSREPHPFGVCGKLWTLAALNFRLRDGPMSSSYALLLIPRPVPAALVQNIHKLAKSEKPYLPRGHKIFDTNPFSGLGVGRRGVEKKEVLSHIALAVWSAHASWLAKQCLGLNVDWAKWQFAHVAAPPDRLLGRERAALAPYDIKKSRSMGPLTFNSGLAQARPLSSRQVAFVSSRTPSYSESPTPPNTTPSNSSLHAPSTPPLIHPRPQSFAGFAQWQYPSPVTPTPPPPAKMPDAPLPTSQSEPWQLAYRAIEHPARLVATNPRNSLVMLERNGSTYFLTNDSPTAGGGALALPSTQHSRPHSFVC